MKIKTKSEPDLFLQGQFAGLQTARSIFEPTLIALREENRTLRLVNQEAARIALGHSRMLQSVLR